MAFNKSRLPIHRIEQSLKNSIEDDWIYKLQDALNHHAQFVPKKLTDQLYLSFDQNTDVYYDTTSDTEFLHRQARRKTDQLYILESSSDVNPICVMGVDINDFFKKHSRKSIEELLSQNQRSQLIIDNQILSVLSSEYRAVILDATSSFFISCYPDLFKHKLSIEEVQSQPFQYLVLIDPSDITDKEIKCFAAIPCQNIHGDYNLAVTLKTRQFDLNKRLSSRLPVFSIDYLNEIKPLLSIITDCNEVNYGPSYIAIKEGILRCSTTAYMGAMIGKRGVSSSSNAFGVNYLNSLHSFLEDNFRLKFDQQRYRYFVDTTIESSFWKSVVRGINRRLNLTLSNLTECFNLFIITVSATHNTIYRKTSARSYKIKFDASYPKNTVRLDLIRQEAPVTVQKSLDLEHKSKNSIAISPVQPPANNLSKLLETLLPYTDSHRIYWLSDQNKLTNLVDASDSQENAGSITNAFKLDFPMKQQKE